MRKRSDAIAMTSLQKKIISEQIGLEKDNLNEEQSKNKMTSIIEEKLKSDNKYLYNNKTNKTEMTVDILPPAFLDIKKDYYTKDEKVIYSIKNIQPVLFSEKARLVDNLDKKYLGDIESYTQNVDFQTFLAKFKNEEEISEFDIQELLNLDYEKLAELKDRTTELIDATSTLVEKSEGNEELLIFFCEKLNVKI